MLCSTFCILYRCSVVILTLFGFAPFQATANRFRRSSFQEPLPGHNFRRVPLGGSGSSHSSSFVSHSVGGLEPEHRVGGAVVHIGEDNAGSGGTMVTQQTSASLAEAKHADGTTEGVCSYLDETGQQVQVSLV